MGAGQKPKLKAREVLYLCSSIAIGVVRRVHSKKVVLGSVNLTNNFDRLVREMGLGRVGWLVYQTLCVKLHFFTLQLVRMVSQIVSTNCLSTIPPCQNKLVTFG